MPLGELDKKYVAEFFRSLPKCLKDETNETTVSYLAVRRDNDVVVLAARMVIGGQASAASLPPELETSSVCAGYFRLSEVKVSAKDYLNRLTEHGSLSLPRGSCSFPGNGSGSHSASLSVLDDAGLHRMRRFTVLKIYGGPQTEMYRRATLDWELKAAQVPYAGVDDLAAEFKFGAIEGQSILFEVLAENVLEVDESSQVKDTTAKIVVNARVKLDRGEVALGVRVVSQGTVVARKYLWSHDFEWKADEHGFDQANATLEVPKGAAVHCTAIYDGVAQHERVVVDQAAYENPLRIAFEVFDSKLVGLRQQLETVARSNDGRDIEPTIGWVLTMLGFQVFYLGGIKLMQDAVDLIAASPSGDFLLVECTTGILKAEKTSNLMARSALVRSALERGGYGHLRVVPVFATTKSEQHIDSDIKAVEKTGAWAVGREQIEEWLRLSAAMSDADSIVSAAHRRLEDIRAEDSRASGVGLRL